MRTLAGLLGLAALMAAAGCDLSPWRQEQDSPVDKWLVESSLDEGVRGAIVTQHTLYPYHFVKDGPALSELGRHDLSVLAEHFRQTAGLLNVYQGEAPDALYQARARAVAAALSEAAVEPGRVVLADGLPGGPGMSSSRVVIILEKKASGGGAEGSGSSAYAPSPMK
jgi:hypothetical protein